MTGLRNFAGRTHKVALAEKIARAHTQLATDNLLVQAVVTVDNHIVHTCLRAFHHAHFKRNGITHNFTFYRNKLVEKISFVHVQVGHCILILAETLAHILLVVHIARLHAEEIVEQFGRIDSVAYPLYILDKVLLPLIDIEVYIHRVLAELRHTVLYNACVAVAFLVIFFKNAVKVVLIVAFHEFFLAEELEKVFLLVGLLHRVLYLSVRENLVAIDINLVYLHLRMLVDIDIHNIFVLF